MKNACPGILRSPRCTVQDARRSDCSPVTVCLFSLGSQTHSLPSSVSLSCVSVSSLEFTCDRHCVKCSSNYGTVFWLPTQYPLSPLPWIAELKCWVNRHTHTHTETDMPRLLLQKEYILNLHGHCWMRLPSENSIKEPDSASSGSICPSPLPSLLGHESTGVLEAILCP